MIIRKLKCHMTKSIQNSVYTSCTSSSWRLLQWYTMILSYENTIEFFFLNIILSWMITFYVCLSCSMYFFSMLLWKWLHKSSHPSIKQAYFCQSLAHNIYFAGPGRLFWLFWLSTLLGCPHLSLVSLTNHRDHSPSLIMLSMDSLQLISYSPSL